MRTLLFLGFSILTSAFISSCGGGGGGSSSATDGTSISVDPQAVECIGQCTSAQSLLSVSDVKTVVAQAVLQAQDLGEQATIAVVDRVGNVLAVFRMAGVDTEVTISTTFPTTITTGLEGIVLPSGANGDALAAIAKAITGAYLSSEGNAFSTRTANQIIQENFNPGETNQPAGPLFGVQFSQLACSDFVTKLQGAGPSVGPHRSPLGLSADPGGFPLYKNGAVVGGVGVIADNRYSIDKNLLDTDSDVDEMIAMAATFSYAAPVGRRADRVTVDGKTLRFTDVNLADLSLPPANAVTFNSFVAADGALVAVNGYSTAIVLAGTAFGQPSSGIRLDSLDYPGLDAFVFVDSGNTERYRPRAGTDGASALLEQEVRILLRSALAVANEARAQIRQPLNSQARVTISVVDSQGEILGVVRSRDAPVFGADVSLQKARTAALFSSADAAVFYNALVTPTVYLDGNLAPKASVSIPDYVTAAKAFIGPTALSDGIAFTDRAGGNLSRPFYPDGIAGNANGPFSKSFTNNEWSVFSTGMQLDLVMNKTIEHVLFAAGATATDTTTNCLPDASSLRAANGIQVFPGSVPIYRGAELVGGIGVSGDGIDQDDMISFLGLHRASESLNSAINNAPADIRADQLAPNGTRLRYVQCPQAPFLNSNEENVCTGL